MKDFIKYDDFIGSVHYSSEDAVFYGKIEGIKDLISYESESIKNLRIAFIEAINDYIYLRKVLKE